MDYIIKKTEVTKSNLKSYSSLFSLVFSNTNKFTLEFLEWQYKSNPHGYVEGFDAYFENDLVGHYAAIPVSYKFKGKIKKGLLSLNTATHPEHRGKGLFTKLALETYKEAKKDGFEFIVGVANENSTPGFIKKLGFELIAPLEVKFGIGEIKSKLENTYRFKPFWDLESLKWRLSCPNKKYYENSSTVFTNTDTIGIKAQLHQNCLGKLKSPKISPLINVWIGIDDNKIRKGVFIELPDVFKPSPLNFIFKDLSGSIGILKKTDIYFELIDFDAY
jgi:GNAT superfamily N-acetyltransferase